MPTRSERRRRLPLTASGAALVAVATATTVTGLILGLAEIAGLGIAMGALVVLALLTVRFRVPALQCVRAPATVRTVVDQSVPVHLTTTHTGAGHSAPVTLRDPIRYPDGRASIARHSVGPLAAGRSESATYGLTIPQRGICRLGPMSIELVDPFGLARRTLTGPDAIEVTVLPRIDVVEPPVFQVRVDTHATTTPSTTFGTEFASLREYARGDDLRKVHWRSSARRDDLVVRRDAEPVRPGCTVLLDVRATSHDSASFEAAVSAAASILVAADRAAQPIRLCTTAGFDSTRSTGSAHLDMVLQRLALIERSPAGVDLPPLGEDPVVVLSAPGGAATLDAGLSGAATALVVDFVPATDVASVHSASSGPRVLRVEPADGFARVWNRRVAELGAHRRVPVAGRA